MQLAGFKLMVVETTHARHAQNLASTIDLSKCPDGIVLSAFEPIFRLTMIKRYCESAAGCEQLFLHIAVRQWSVEIISKLYPTLLWIVARFTLQLFYHVSLLAIWNHMKQLLSPQKTP